MKDLEPKFVKEETERNGPVNDYIVIMGHFVALIATAFLIPMTDDFVQLVVLVLFALLFVKTIQEVTARF